MKKGYYYIFYKLYKFWEYVSIPKFLSDLKAGICIASLEAMFFFSFIVYYTVITKNSITLSFKKPIIYIPTILIILLNYFSFVHTNQWKTYNREFDKLSKDRNRLGSWIVFGVILLIIANIVFAFYLDSKIDWNQYR